MVFFLMFREDVNNPQNLDGLIEYFLNHQLLHHLNHS